jgi:type I restriction enzyme S subunit
MTATALQEIDVALPRRKWPSYPRYRPTRVSWLHEVPHHWIDSRADAFTRELRVTIQPEQLAGQSVFHYSIPVVQEIGDGQIENGDDIDSSKTLIARPVLLVSKLNPRKKQCYHCHATRNANSMFW